MRKILIIGFGSIGQKHLKVISNDEEYYEIAILSSQNINSNNFQVFHVIDDALRFNPDIVIICSPSPTHLSYIELFKSKKILVEKPLSIGTPNEHLPQLSNLDLMVGYNLRFNETLKYFINIIQQIGLDDIIRINVCCYTFLPNWRSRSYQSSVSAQKKLGGGVINELSHELNYLIWILGDIPDIKYVRFSKESSLDIDVEDYAEMLLEYKGINCSLILDFSSHIEKREIVVKTENLTYKWNGLDNSVSKITSKDSSELKRIPNATVESYKNQWDFFKNASAFELQKELKQAILTHDLITYVKSYKS